MGTSGDARARRNSAWSDRFARPSRNARTFGHLIQRQPPNLSATSRSSGSGRSIGQSLPADWQWHEKARDQRCPSQRRVRGGISPPSRSPDKIHIPPGGRWSFQACALHSSEQPLVADLQFNRSRSEYAKSLSCLPQAPTPVSERAGAVCFPSAEEFRRGI